MAVKFGNRVRETTTSTGTGPLDLNGAVAGFRGVAAEFSDGDEFYYLTVDDPAATTQYEYGKGGFIAGAPNRVTRDVVEGSSNGGALVNWGAGTKTIAAVLTAQALEDLVAQEIADEIAAVSSVPTGMMAPMVMGTPPTGWLALNGDTMGSAASGATRASASYETLFGKLWDNWPDSVCTVSGGRGANAAADWAANKTITLPNFGGRTLVGSGAGAGLTTRAIGDSGGAETVSLTASQNGPHSHPVNNGSLVVRHAGTGQVGGTGLPRTTDTITTQTSGSGSAHENMPPWMAAPWMVKW